MKKLSETSNQIIESGDVSDAELIKVDIQVRTGGNIQPPPWFRSAKVDPKAQIKLSPHKIRRAT